MDCTEPLVQDPYQKRVRKWRELCTAKYTDVRPDSLLQSHYHRGRIATMGYGGL